VPYRKQRENWDAMRVDRLREFKKKVTSRLGEAGANVVASERLVDGERKAKKRKGKKERTREKAARAPEEAEVVEEVEPMATDSPRQSKKYAKLRRDDEEDEGIITTSEPEPVKKKRRRQKKTEKHVEQAVV